MIITVGIEGGFSVMAEIQADASDEMFFTVTMAEILESQGKMEDALAVYTLLSRSRPDDENIASQIKRLKGLARSE